MVMINISLEYMSKYIGFCHIPDILLYIKLGFVIGANKIFKRNHLRSLEFRKIIKFTQTLTVLLHVN